MRRAAVEQNLNASGIHRIARSEWGRVSLAAEASSVKRLGGLEVAWRISMILSRAVRFSLQARRSLSALQRSSQSRHAKDAAKHGRFGAQIAGRSAPASINNAAIFTRPPSCGRHRPQCQPASRGSACTKPRPSYPAPLTPLVKIASEHRLQKPPSGSIRSNCVINPSARHLLRLPSDGG